MKTSTALFRKTTLWACLVFVALGAYETTANTETRVERWGVFELVLDGPDSESAYVDVTFAATFESDSKTVTVPGFYDGNGKYKIRFSPPTLGRWTFSTESNRGNLAAKTGSFICISPSPGNHGPVQEVNTFYLQYADGTPYYAVGTTAYQWTSVKQSVQEKTLETLATAPFNKIRMCVFPKWYRHGNNTEPWIYPFQRDGGKNDFTRPNYEFFRNFDLRVRQLADMGIQADVILFHSYDNWGYDKMGREHDDRYLRYMIARLSAYRNVWWSMANEYDLMIRNKEKTMADFDRFFQICQNEDPHQRLRGNHNWYYSEDHFYDHSYPWVTHASLQTNQFYNLLKWRNQYQKPVLVDEMRYEGDVSSGWGNLSAEEMTSYFWMAGLSGAYPTHGDTFDNRAGGGETRWWGKGGTLPGKSVPRIAFFKEIMEQAPVTEMTPAIEIEGTGSTETLNDNIHIFAKPGEYYLAYVASAGKTIRLDLPEGTHYTVELIDTQNLTIKQLPNVAPGNFSFKTPIRYNALRVIAEAGLSDAPKAVAKTNLPFRQWLFEYIPSQYPDAKMTDHHHWLQAHITDNLVANWTEWTDEDSTLKAMEAHSLKPGKALFIEQKGQKKDWADHPAVTYYEGAGYYISGYDPATMSSWDGKGLSVIQFDGDAKVFAEKMAKAWAGTTKTAAKSASKASVQEMEPSARTSNASQKLRVIMMSDFPPIGVVKGGNVPNNQKSDPDDMQSMVRFLLYANEFDIEGLIASAGTFAMEAHKKNILCVLDRYEKVYGNLKSHDPDYPTTDYLRSVTYEGLGNNHGLSIKWGSKTQPVTDIIGEGKDSEASNAIVAAADKPDPRPLWIGVWGTPREVSQAIWRVRKDRSAEEFKAFISKLRIFLIAYQDCTHSWLMNEFPDLFIIDSRKTYQGFFGGRDPISNLAWVNENIRKNHGPLCDIYPHEGMGCTGVCEGDSPTFMYLVSANRGINDPEDPTQPSWGGQYKRKGNTNHYVDGPGGSSISRWRKDFQKEFAERADWCVTSKVQKPRIINTTDLGADPDDEQSMVRFLVCSNEFDTEGLIVATGCWKKNQSSTAMLDKLVNAYAEVYDNLKCHADGYPTPEYLKSISVMGQRGYGMSDVGDCKDSPGSEMIIAAVDKDDPRPVWIGCWGGVNNVAQAIWKVQKTRSEAELKKFISKLRVFDILGQDDAGAWLAKNFPDLFYIRATGVYGWQPSKNDPYLRTHIQSHGPLGAVYPNTKWATEGDTPAFMHVYPNGLNDPDKIDQGGWGGRFSFIRKKGIRSMSGVTRIQKDGETRYDPYYMYGNTPEKAGAIKRWSKGYNNDFEARMDWTMTSDYSKANHHPVAVVNGDTTRQVLEVSASAGSTVALSAVGSSDPDGDSLAYTWSFYQEPSSYSGAVSIENSSSASATVTIPSNAGGKNIHIILELHDNGSPNLYAYRRVIISVQ